MRLEIDQSNKIEQTSKKTAIGLSNNVHLAVSISGTEKQKLLTYFRKINQRKMFMVLTFCALICFLLNMEDFNTLEIYIDREYNGYDQFIKNKITELLNKKLQKKLDIHQLHIIHVGRGSNAHKVANEAGKNKFKSIKITSNQILKLIS